MDFNSINIVKEREFLNVYNLNGVFLGGYNFKMNKCIGKNRRPVETYPRCFNYWSWENVPEYDFHEYDAENPIPDKVFYGKVISEIPSILHYNLTEDARNFFESLVSLKLIPNSYYVLDEGYSRVKLNKKFVEYARRNDGYYLDGETISCYGSASAINKIQQDENIREEYKSRSLLARLTQNNLPDDFLYSVIKRCSHERVDMIMESYSFENDLERLISNYYKHSMELYNKVTVDRNFLVKYCEIEALYKIYADKKITENLREKNNLPHLYFETEQYTIYPLLTKDAFHDEATRQGNCVERLYMQQVAEGQTHVVVVRNKMKPAESLITCEVSNDGDIIQYLARFNRRPTEDDLLALKKQYQAHLKESIY